MGWWHHGLGFGGWESILIGGLMMLLFWGGLIALMFFVIRAAVGGRNGASGKASSENEALSILDRRYAQGEIDADTYHQMKNELKA